MPDQSEVSEVAPHRQEAQEEPPHCPCCNCELEEGNTVECDSEDHCPDCVHTCEECGHATTDLDELHSASTVGYYRPGHASAREQQLCEECSFACADCGYRFSNAVSEYSNANDDRICERCQQNYYTCDDCGCVTHCDDIHSDDDNNYCGDCWPAHDTSCELVHDYSYRPTPSFHLGSKQTRRRVDQYLGVEVEVEATKTSNHDEAIESSGLADKPAFYCKEDGSLDDGFEIVSHPCSFEWWKEADLSFLGSLKAKGYRSFDTASCGMHVHVSRKSLSQLDIFKLLRFFQSEIEFVKAVSRRESSNLRRWAAVDESGPHDLVRKVKDRNKDHDERYTAINLVPTNTVEFRIFRGTLDKSAFMRNLSFIVALIAYVKQSSLFELNRGSFLRFIKHNGTGILGKTQARDLGKWLSSL
jgi:hypothetical protein